MFWNRVNRTNGGGGGANEYVGRPLGRVLVKMGKITREQVVEGLTIQKQRGGRLGEVLVHLGYVTSADVDAALAAQRGDDPGDRSR